MVGFRDFGLSLAVVFLAGLTRRYRVALSVFSYNQHHKQFLTSVDQAVASPGALFLGSSFGLPDDSTTSE